MLKHFGALTGHLDELQAAEAEVNVLVVFEDVWIIRVGVFEGFLDISV